MVFIEFLLAKNYEKLLFTKNNAYLMNFLNICEKSRIYIFLKQREYIIVKHGIHNNYLFTWTCERVRLPIYSTELIINNQTQSLICIERRRYISNLFTLIPEEIEQITLENHVVMCVKLIHAQSHVLEPGRKDRRGWTFKVYLA